MIDFEQNPKVVTAAEFLSRPLDPLTFYDLLPREIEIVDSGERRSLDVAARLLLSAREAFADEALVEDSLIAAVNGEATTLPQAQIVNLADKASEAYANLLATGKSNRSLRMKLQQLNFLLRAHLDHNVDAAGQCRATRSLGTSAPPWDWLGLGEDQFIIVSGVENVRWVRNGIAGGASCGLPSQLDLLPDHRISIGSIFSNGAWLLDSSSLEHIAHARPIVLVFAHEGEDWAVDYDGRIFALSRGPANCIQAPLQQVDRARLVNGRLFLSDWSRIREVIVLDLSSRAIETRTLPGILLLNDICAANGGFYGICKQQGRVFGYEADFSPRGTQLGFGRGEGRLFDPVTVRADSGGLQVLNWITGTLVTLDPF